MPAVSQRQRAWAFAVKGDAWARRHHFDTKGPLPKRKGKKSSRRHLYEKAVRG